MFGINSKCKKTKIRQKKKIYIYMLMFFSVSYRNVTVKSNISKSQ